MSHFAGKSVDDRIEDNVINILIDIYSIEWTEEMSTKDISTFFLS